MIHRLIARLQGGLGRLAGDRLAWRIAITILLGIVGTQIGTILLIDWARPKELSLYSVSAIVAEVSHFATSGGLDAMTADLEEVPVDEVEPLEPEIPHPWPLHELERRLRVSLENGPVVEVRIGPRHLRRPIGPLGLPLHILFSPGPPPELRQPHGAVENFLVPGIFAVWLKYPDNHWRVLVTKRTEPGLPHWLLPTLWLTLMAVIIGCLAFWSTWRLLRPLKSIMASLRGWHAGRDPIHIEERGPAEFQAIAAAINDMQAKLRHFVQSRSELVLALSHDLRTPLTRLQLRTEYMEDAEQRQRMLSELHFMEMLTDQLLAFASFDPRTEKLERVDLAVLIGSLCDDRNDAGGVVEYAGPAHMIVACRPTAMRRALMNVIDNAIKYSDYAYVILEEDPAGARVTIRDSGPGIPETDLELVFEPFYRVDASRNSETGGLGMGLSVARTIIIEHRGQIRLRNRRPHGLEVEIELPLSQAA
jgi:signal transduction histidine kinase